jgi:hypothetical protein
MAKRFHNSTKSAMISEDSSAACFLPTGVIEKKYPSEGGAVDGKISSLYAAVSKQTAQDKADLKRALNPTKP